MTLFDGQNEEAKRAEVEPVSVENVFFRECVPAVAGHIKDNFLGGIKACFAKAQRSDFVGVVSRIEDDGINYDELYSDYAVKTA